ncbi:hypothetical protein GOBAR_AA28858 [Gossypium barbadense]|uniref:Ribosomal protein L7/L12 C-terminal domain-containing protein n=1 Tax=Gossypium barbadense TaxID=3634 RepID=A0A2P5WL60_GOSBA|nr:hypothetical protein GOBAR_AA28858 [Gossypium barbadense]
MEPLQVRTFQHDFVPKDPNAKPKRFEYAQVYDPYGPRPPLSDKVIELAERIAAVPPEERRQIGPTVTERLRHPKMQVIADEGMDLGGAGAGAGAPKAEEKKEKTAFDVKLEKFDAAAKIKAPVILKQGITKDEANDIMEKIKAAGGVAVME